MENAPAYKKLLHDKTVKRLDELRRKNDRMLNETDTAVLRGRIAEAGKLLEFLEEEESRAARPTIERLKGRS